MEALITQESRQKPTLTDKPKERRKRLFQVLDSIISFAEEKRVLKGNSDKAKQAWSRIAISAIDSYGNLLKTDELQNIEARLEALEHGKTRILEPLPMRENLLDRLKREENERKQAGMQYD